ncbi:glycosyltransferase family 2 protein [Flavobacteriales bacterium]|nr:glycosyltransferase family 2 protein [Flavobacteriales bacterium]
MSTIIPEKLNQHISVVVTTYNRPDKLLRCLQAIQAQTKPPLETLIVHDGSPADYTAPMALVTEDPNMVWVEQTNQGVSAARNNGVELAKGTFIAFCDDDDFWLPHHIEHLEGLIAKEDSAPGIYHTQRRELRGKEWTDLEIHKKPSDLTWQEHYITKGEMVMCCTCMHKDVLQFSPFPEGIKYAEDHEQRLIALSRFPCFPSTDRTVVIDRTDETATNRSIHEIAAIYRGRFDAMFAIPTIAQHIRRQYRHRARFRWTSLEVSAARRQGAAPFIMQWFKSIPHIRSWSNLKTMILQVVWFINDNLK